MNNITETGIKRTDEGVFCEKCGNDLSKDGSVTFASHIDGVDFYSYTFTCNKCGNAITQTVKRTEEDKMWWGNDE